MVDNQDNYSNKIYFLETDKTHTKDDFKILYYCSIENFEFKSDYTTFPKKGSLNIDIKNVYDIDNNMQSKINKKFTEFKPSTDKKLYIVHEKDNEQYLYYIKEYTYSINNKKISIENYCFQTKFDNLADEDANTNFIKRVTNIQEGLVELGKHIDDTRDRKSVV